MAKATALYSKDRANQDAPFLTVSTAAPLNAAVTTDWMFIGPSNILIVDWSVTRVAATADAIFAVQVSYDNTTTAIAMNTGKDTDGAIAVNPTTLILTADSTNTGIVAITLPMVHCHARLVMAAAVTNAGATDLITVKMAAGAI